jgi:hypothetical protein
MPHLFAESTKCLRNKLDWALPVGRAYLFDVPVSEAMVQSTATAHPSTASADSSWQKFTSSPASRVSTYCEAEPIFETRSRQDEKERKQSDDSRRWPDDSYSPRRHWCSILKPDR